MPAFTTVIEHYWQIQLRQLYMRKIKGIQIEKGEIKTISIADDIILCLENHKESTRRMLELINEFSEVEGYKIITQKSIIFLYTSSEQHEKKT